MGSTKTKTSKPEITEEALNNIEAPEAEQAPAAEETKEERALEGKVKPAPKAPVSAQAELAQLSDRLDSFPLVKVIIPLGAGEKAGKSTEAYGWNGVIRHYPKGIRIDVPSPIAEIIEQTYGLREAEEQYRLQGAGDAGVNLTGQI